MKASISGYKAATTIIVENLLKYIHFYKYIWRHYFTSQRMYIQYIQNQPSIQIVGPKNIQHKASQHSVDSSGCFGFYMNICNFGFLDVLCHHHVMLLPYWELKELYYTKCQPDPPPAPLWSG